MQLGRLQKSNGTVLKTDHYERNRQKLRFNQTSSNLRHDPVVLGRLEGGRPGRTPWRRA
jgi:hypothetical protein